jgi:hypothetical protein
MMAIPAQPNNDQINFKGMPVNTMQTTSTNKRVRALVAAACTSSAFAFAQQAPVSADENASPANKLTLGGYRFSSGATGVDLNLRNTSDWGDVWAGVYESRERNEHQARIGWDRTIDAGIVRFIPSVQYASRGYIAGSINVETGNEWFAGAGFGRTNLRPNWNLNFDPNDSYSLTAGHRTSGGQSFAIQWVRDDRQNPDQRHLHFVYRTPLPGKQRLTFDVLYKQGMVDDTAIRKWGASVTYDWPAFFIRVAYDPNVNFTADNMTRLSVGTRF